MTEKRSIFCCHCCTDVSARLTDGREVYPWRKDLGSLPFWICDNCGNFVGCHHKTADRTKPLGVIATPDLKRARMHIHALIDPLWKSKRIKRGKIYAKLGDILGRQYHTSELRTLDEARAVYRAAQQLAQELSPCSPP